ncbi:hypothetical protein [Rhizobium leguminosarum]|nr:hypothetical protein [Rhizobium leguminosarum]
MALHIGPGSAFSLGLEEASKLQRPLRNDQLVVLPAAEPLVAVAW